jgi:ketopantoate reductase
VKIYSHSPVVPAAEDASTISKQPFDYVLLCVKALPDVYDLANIIQSVVSPQHTCILLNTTSALGVEDYLSQRFPTNVVLSLVCGAELIQLGASEFEHRGDSTDIWVGWANKNSRIPESIQKDMAEALAMTLTTGNVNCAVSENIRQQQFDRMIGYTGAHFLFCARHLLTNSRRPIAFHPASVLFDTPNHAELLEITGVRTMVVNLVDELITLAKGHGCTFPDDFRETTVQTMIQPADRNSIMYQDYVDRRPMEVETYLGSPIKLAKEIGTSVPRVETLYALLHHKNTINLKTPAGPPISPGTKPPPPRSSSFAANGPQRPMMNGGPPNGMPNGRRMPSYNGGPTGPMRRGPPPNGYPPRMPNGHANGFPPDGSMPRRSSIDDELGEFSHVMLYDNNPESGLPEAAVYGDDATHAGSTTDLALRERELAIRARELELRERQMSMRRGPPPRRPPPNAAAGWDDDEDDDYFDPMGAGQGPSPAVLDENFDMMSITSRRNKRAPPNPRAMNAGMGGAPPRGRGMPFNNRKQNRTSVRVMSDLPNLTESILANPLLGYSSNRYANVDRGEMGKESRQNSLTTERLNELSQGGMSYGAYPPPIQRRQSQSPGNPLSPPVKRPSPPNGYPQANGHMNGRPSPPGMRQPVPRYPPGHGNVVAPSQVEQHAGVSNPYPQKPNPQVRSLTGSASASAASGESSGASARVDSSTSSENSSLETRPVAKTALGA